MSLARLSPGGVEGYKWSVGVRRFDDAIALQQLKAESQQRESIPELILVIVAVGDERGRCCRWSLRKEIFCFDAKSRVVRELALKV